MDEERQEVIKVLTEAALNTHPSYSMHARFWGQRCNAEHSEKFWDVPSLELRTGGRLLQFHQYKPVMERIMKIRATYSNGRGRGVCVLGNPGAGKSTFLDYFLINILCEKQEVLLYRDDIISIHLAEGCFALLIGSFSRIAFSSIMKDMIALIDSDTIVGEPPAVLVGSSTPFFPVQAALPRPDRYKAWTKQRSARFIVVDPPSCEEIHTVMDWMDISPKPTLDDVTSIVAKWGPNIRVLEDIFDDGEEEYETNLRQELNQAPGEDLEKMFRSSHDVHYGYSHSIITTYRENKAPAPGDRHYTKSDYMQHRITSPYIWRVLILTHTQSRRAELSRVFAMLHASNYLGAPRGLVFEPLAHDKLLSSQGASIRLLPMVLAEDQLVFLNGTTEIDVRLFPSGSVPKMCLYASSTKIADTHQPSVYYVPKESNNPTFDSYVIINGVGIAFQMTVGRSHSLNVKGLALLKARFEPLQVAKHRFVFVVPKGQEFRIPAPKPHWLKIFDFYVLALECDDAHFFSLDNEQVRPGDGNPDWPEDADSPELEDLMFNPTVAARSSHSYIK